jgi:hypothetical protein
VGEAAGDKWTYHRVYTHACLLRSLERQPFILPSELQTRHLSIWLTSLYKTGMTFVFSVELEQISPINGLDQDPASFFYNESDNQILGFAGHEISIYLYLC